MIYKLEHKALGFLPSIRPSQSNIFVKHCDTKTVKESPKRIWFLNSSETYHCNFQEPIVIQME